ncbi:hypothetical protein [Leptospira levettii]|uniref:DNA recombination protein RmuC n=1 Tax=Leptospira levettii TaxID=2023178 RepID=A0AAW5VBI0_9LEPT|nr:hypothetical protein [Leptospira levettii]MCW7467871.1 hypothetical protein [Leptospira levettii]MCW7513485.1 hypothetical protein [Leptospira levettii]MCW7517229.1 hypothetical protein [Leptospira levettii]
MENIFLTLLIIIVLALVYIIYTLVSIKKLNHSEIERDLTSLALLQEISNVSIEDLNLDKNQTSSIQNLIQLLNISQEKENLEIEILKNKIKTEIIEEYKNSNEFKNIIKLKKNNYEKDGIEKFKKSDEFLLLLKNEFSNGFEKGQKEAFNELKIKITPYKDQEDGIFRDDITYGIQYQLFLRGIPIMGPSINIIKKEKKVNEDRIKLIDKILRENLSNAVKLISDSGIKTIV